MYESIERNDQRIASTVSKSRKLILDSYARKVGMTLSVLIRVALNEYLDNHFPGWRSQEENTKGN